MARDLFFDILNQLPSESTLIVVDRYNDFDLQQSIEMRNDSKLIYTNTYWQSDKREQFFCFLFIMEHCIFCDYK